MTMRRFVLDRDYDVSGVSGTGVVCEGVEFSDGTCFLRWTGDWPCSAVFWLDGIKAIMAVHGHGGATRVVWIDPEPASGAEPGGPPPNAGGC
jgi:hypothetical protein